MTGYSESGRPQFYGSSEDQQEVSEHSEANKNTMMTFKKQHRYAPLEDVCYDNEFSNGLTEDGDEQGGKMRGLSIRRSNSYCKFNEYVAPSGPTYKISHGG